MGLDLNWPTELAEHASDGFRVSGADDFPIPQPASRWITVGIGIANEKCPKILVIQLEHCIAIVARGDGNQVVGFRIGKDALRRNMIASYRTIPSAVDARAPTLSCGALFFRRIRTWKRDLGAVE